ncbi:MAG: B12-binding domain-containing radical SAM protein [Candidatus Brocadiales bacterium]
MRVASPVILLEHPRPRDLDRFQDVVNAPLSASLLCPYTSSLLRLQEIPVEILDANLMGWSMQQTIEELKKRSPTLLGVHMVYLWDKTGEVFDMLSRLRNLNPQTHINLFGFFPTFSYEEILQKFPFIDSVTVGEPEYTFLELARFLLGETTGNPRLPMADGRNCHSEGVKSASGGRNVACELARTYSWQQAATLHASLRMTDGIGATFAKVSSNTTNLDYSGIDGLAFSSDGATPNGCKVIRNRPRALISDLDGLPFPDRSHIHQYEKHGIATYILGSRGCYGHCTFCYINPSYGSDSSWRGRSAENVFEEIFYLYNDRGTRYFYFADANFFGPGREGKKRASQLADLIINNKLEIRFGIECRANDVEKDSLSGLVRAGLREVFLGVESGCQHILNRFKKGVSTEVNARAVETLRRSGIEPSLGFIMFHPDSRLTDVRENFEFLKRLKLLRSPAVTAHLLHHRQTFFRGTPDFSLALDRPGARLESFVGYEALCEFDDPKVAAFSEVATNLCRRVLEMLRPDKANVCKARVEDPTRVPQGFSPAKAACNTGIENDMLTIINDAIINAYDRILTSFEDGEAIRNPSQARRICDEFLKDISFAHEKTSERIP